ncbi:zinc finger and SCAN domain-containing protein 2-like isoform X3 [Diachasmimorpha longicaudata]|uniref:zinc finger and SCAN domain-containing protein 2-like isoform X3 n=1 Tax=Diachasmimorpha longicaudata TaxID=58733 RepID=UPI0030B891B8
MSSYDCMELCRLCLVKDRVSVPIFEGEGDVRQIFLKIAACLPVKVGRDDKLPKKICDDCVYKVELLYDFWNTTANAEKQLLQWLGEDGEDKQGYVSSVMNSELMKQETVENRLDSSVMQTEEHQNNMNMNMMDQMGLTMPMIMSTDQQQITSVPMASSGNNIQVVAGTSSQSSRGRKSGNNEDDEEESEDEENSEDECDNDGGINVKEETPESGRNVEPSFVNVSIPCEEAGPSGVQQQKITDMPEMVMAPSEGDPKSGYYVSKLAMLSQDDCNVGEMKVLVDGDTELVLSETLQVKNDESLEDILPSQIVQCALCGDGFMNENELALHIKTHESLQSQTDDNQELIDNDIEDEKIVYVCEHCGRSFTTTGMLRKHQQQMHSQTSEKIHTCEMCGYSSVHKQNVINHMRRHNQEYKYCCEICGAGFYARNIYLEHQLIHSREKPFQCEICNATFRYRQGLRLHAKLHQPDYVPPQKKHLCELCNKRFSRKQVLLVHMRTHGGGGPQNEYVCHICGKAVSSKTYLTVHVRKHTGEKPHVCDLCGKGFISQNYLSVHRRTHTGERPHQCTHCEKRFTQRTTLVVHLRGHTGDRPYPCTFCQKSFASKTMLNSHLKTHAKQNARAQQEQLLKEEHLQDGFQHLQETPNDHLTLEELQSEEIVDELQEQAHTTVLENVAVLLPG